MKITERKYIVENVITFKKTNEIFGGLSNMAPGYSLRVNEVLIPSAEALYQACRFPLFPAIQEEIILQRSPMSAKMISRKYNSHTRQDWEEVKYEIMYWVLQVKLSQNFKSFSNLLRQTKAHQIVELSSKDKDWAAVYEDGYLVGKNALGRLLMKLRKEFIFENKNIDCVEPLRITGFLLFGSEIERACRPTLEYAQKYMFDFEYS